MRIRPDILPAINDLNNYSEPLILDMVSKKQRVFFNLLISIWFISILIFFTWWFDVAHLNGYVRFSINTIILFWVFVMPAYFFYFVSRMKRVNPAIKIQSDWRIAMITTRTQSEPFELVKKTLLAILAQNIPHDTWLADEEPNEEIKKWCRKNGVNLWSRFGVANYHNKSWPRRTKCKEGNMAFFYDNFGYQNYDFVAQLDADHVPAKGYLEAMMRPFVNDKVGYVSAPSICNANAANSWSARGRLYAESILHGPLQAGHNGGYAPLCIGSHYAVRTKALKEIGGIGPELAEDHSTTLMMNSAGWQGVHNIDALAYGEGPRTFADCVVQEFQWSRSLMFLLLTETPKHWRKLRLRQRIQFLFAQLWYPLFSMIMFIGFLLPVIAVITKEPFVSVSLIDFIVHSLPINFSIFCIVLFLKLNGWLRPIYSPIISWESVLFTVMRWPWSLYGCMMGVVCFLTGKVVNFKVTPKGANSF